jgi:hypothetical protein
MPKISSPTPRGIFRLEQLRALTARRRVVNESQQGKGFYPAGNLLVLAYVPNIFPGFTSSGISSR